LFLLHVHRATSNNKSDVLGGFLTHGTTRYFHVADRHSVWLWRSKQNQKVQMIDVATSKSCNTVVAIRFHRFSSVTQYDWLKEYDIIRAQFGTIDAMKMEFLGNYFTIVAGISLFSSWYYVITTRLQRLYVKYLCR